jgi:hypothetical protein
MMQTIFKFGQWASFFLGCPFLMIGSGLMWVSDICHDKAIDLVPLTNGQRGDEA